MLIIERMDGPNQSLPQESPDALCCWQQHDARPTRNTRCKVSTLRSEREPRIILRTPQTHKCRHDTPCRWISPVQVRRVLQGTAQKDMRSVAPELDFIIGQLPSYGMGHGTQERAASLRDGTTSISHKLARGHWRSCTKKLRSQSSEINVPATHGCHVRSGRCGQHP